MLTRRGLSTFCQGGCDQETIVPTTERCCRCIEPEAACNEITTEDLNPGYKCNEVDYDDEDGSCNIGGTVKASKEGDNNTVATVIIDLLGLRAVEPGDQVFTTSSPIYLWTLSYSVCKSGQTALLHATPSGCSIR